MYRLLLFCLLLPQLLPAQKGYLFVKKNGKKVKTYAEGQPIKVLLTDGAVKEGYVYVLRNDSIFLGDVVFHKSSVKQILLPRKPQKPFDKKQLLYITAGVFLSTAGMTLSGYESLDKALLNSVVIGYGPLLFSRARRFVGFKRKRYRIGKKFSLHVLDFYLPPSSRKTF